MSRRGNYHYHQTRQSRIFFSASRTENEAYLGLCGKLVDSYEEKGDGWSDFYETYEYEMGWFGADELMTTHYVYRNDYLDHVEILPAQSGYTTERMAQLITAMHGESVEADSAAKHWDWADELYGKYISLTEKDSTPLVTVSPYSLGISNVLASYEVKDGEAVIDDAQDAKVWELLCRALPVEYRQKIGEFRLFTDGYSNILAVTSTVGDLEHPDNTHFIISVDYYDVFDENGEARDLSKLLFTLIHEYGHVLLENDTQIDVSVDPDIHDPETFIEGSFRQRYYEKFWQDAYASYLGTYEEKPENYVSGYAGNAFHEDIAETFALFVFGSKPTGDSVAEQKLRFFWDDSDMVALRQSIRMGLELQ